MGRYVKDLERAISDKGYVQFLTYEARLARGESPDLPANDRTSIVWAMREAKQAVEARSLRCALKVHAGDKC